MSLDLTFGVDLFVRGCNLDRGSNRGVYRNSNGGADHGVNRNMDRALVSHVFRKVAFFEGVCGADRIGNRCLDCYLGRGTDRGVDPVAVTALVVV